MTEKQTYNRKARILVADNEPDLLEIIGMALKDLDAEITLAEDGREALNLITSHPFDLVVTDQSMPGLKGTELLAAAQETMPNPPLFILITAYGTIDMAVQAMRMGAFDFIKKPFELEEFSNRVSRALDALELEEENRNLRHAVEAHYIFSEIIGSSKPLRDSLDLARRAAEKSSPVLILGESGTGKDLLARAIHFHGPRQKKPFIAINCGAIPENLIESEFFGHKKGAFTGAISSRRGCFEEAAGGTIFLDEIAEMPFDLQVKLLRVLEENRIRRVGENTEVPVDFRIIAATNRPLAQLVEEGKFRQDLFYRLNVLTITLPPLRQRKEDIVPLSEHFMRTLQDSLESPVKRMSNQALETLQDYDYPGNVRELINILQRAILLCDGPELMPHHLPREIQEDKQSIRVPSVAEATEMLPIVDGVLDLKTETRRAQRAVEERLIREALRTSEGNHKKAAELLGISRGSLYNKMQNFSKPLKFAQ